MVGTQLGSILLVILGISYNDFSKL
jgi:hypothetical protein